MANVKTIDHKLVLLVDDDRHVRESMSQLLDAKGYSTVQAENGQKALEILKETPHLPCLIVLDLAMPVMDGYRFLRLRAQGSDSERGSSGHHLREPPPRSSTEGED